MYIYIYIYMSIYIYIPFAKTTGVRRVCLLWVYGVYVCFVCCGFV